MANNSGNDAGPSVCWRCNRIAPKHPYLAPQCDLCTAIDEWSGRILLAVAVALFIWWVS